jgi:ribose transport system ATP-binding protein
VTQNGQVSLEVRGVHKRYGETRALVHLDLTCERGTVHTIFGENGSGKSTMVKILSGIIPPDGGEVTVNGQRVTRFEPQAMRALGIATVFQEVLVAPNRTALDNIFLGYDGLFMRQMPRSQRAEVAQDTLARLTTTRIDLGALVGNLPLPQRQLIVIARALVRKPTLLILDEATAALDIGDRQALFSTIMDFVAGDRSVIYISHRVDEVLQLSNQVTILRSGDTITTVPAAGLTAAKLLQLVLPVPIAQERINV